MSIYIHAGCRAISLRQNIVDSTSANASQIDAGIVKISVIGILLSDLLLLQASLSTLSVSRRYTEFL
jgi:hypothetical protein